MKKITIGFQLAPQGGDFADMRKAWVEAEELGADCLYVSDHFNKLILDEAQATRQEGGGKTVREKMFESTIVQAAMATTTTRPRIGCIVHGNSYRNPNLLADIARTIDHAAGGGRYILGIGTGYLKADYDEYGFEFGTQKSRALALQRDVPIIKERLAKLVPPPVGHMPLLIASMGEGIGMRIVAEHADMWHVFGYIETVREKIAAMRRICSETGRNFDDLELCSYYYPQMMGGRDADPSIFLQEGIRHIVLVAEGPTWDRGQLREMLAWRRSVEARA